MTKESNNSIIVHDSVMDNKKIVSIQRENNMNLDSVKQKILKSKSRLHLSDSDTIEYQFILEDVGTEGNEAIAFYLNDSIQKIRIDIYTSMWKYQLLYLFHKTSVRVSEHTYNIYDKEIELIKTLSYMTDLSGIPLEKVDSNRVDIFQGLRQVVPFYLKE